jgi:hypothetical protein
VQKKVYLRGMYGEFFFPLQRECQCVGRCRRRNTAAAHGRWKSTWETLPLPGPHPSAKNEIWEKPHFFLLCARLLIHSTVLLAMVKFCEEILSLKGLM